MTICRAILATSDSDDMGWEDVLAGLFTWATEDEPEFIERLVRKSHLHRGNIDKCIYWGPQLFPILDEYSSLQESRDQQRKFVEERLDKNLEQNLVCKS